MPSNLILEKIGARRWIGRIMISWGIVSGAFAFTQGPISFFCLRFGLGLAEAGFFPGMILYFTYWFPPLHRARIVAGFMAAIPVSLGLGAPVSTAFLELDGVLGLAGWKWLFLGEAAARGGLRGRYAFSTCPTVRARRRGSPPRKNAGSTTRCRRRRRTSPPGAASRCCRRCITRACWRLAAIHFGQAAVSVGLAVFSAQIVKSMGLTNMQTGFATAIPYIFGTAGMILWGNYSDRKNERRWNLTGSCTVMMIGCLLAGLYAGTWWSIAGLSLMTVGLYAGNAHLFPLPSVFLAGPALASGIAWVNSVGILGRQRVAAGYGLAEGLHRQLCRRALCAGRVRADGGAGLGDLRARDAGGPGWRSSPGNRRVASPDQNFVRSGCNSQTPRNRPPKLLVWLIVPSTRLMR